MESERDARSLGLLLMDAMNTRDVSSLEQYVRDDAVFDFPGAGTLSGRKRIVTFLKALFRKYPRLEFAVEDLVAEGDRACVIWRNSGESRKGTGYSNRGVTLVQAAGGMLVYISDYFKDTSFAGQQSQHVTGEKQ